MFPTLWHSRISSWTAALENQDGDGSLQDWIVYPCFVIFNAFKDDACPRCTNSSGVAAKALMMAPLGARLPFNTVIPALSVQEPHTV